MPRPASRRMRIGPWPTGLNQLDDPELVADSDLTECLNFDITNDGVLIPRRGFQRLGINNASGMVLLGTVIEGDTYAIASVSNGAGNSSFNKVSDPAVGWAAAFGGASVAGTYGACVQYNGKVWIVRSNAVGGYSAPSTTGALTAVAAMPKGNSVLVLHDRLLIIDKAASRIYWSKATDPTVWANPDGGFVDINPGDGEVIHKVLIYGDNLLIFKTNSTYLMSFTSDPATDGVVRQVASDIGGFDAVIFNNEVYCVNARSVFKYVNGFFIDLALKIALPKTEHTDAYSTPASKTYVVDHTLIVGPVGDATADPQHYYAMNLSTFAWSKYQVKKSIAPNQRWLTIRSSNGSNVVCTNGTGAFYLPWVNTPDHSLDEDSAGLTYWPGYKITTKAYTFGDAELWKRLYWWALEGTDVDKYPASIDTVPIVEVVVNESIHLPATDVVDRVNTTSCRFRSIEFSYRGDGRTIDSATAKNTTLVPKQIQSISAYAAAKQPVST